MVRRLRHGGLATVLLLGLLAGSGCSAEGPGSTPRPSASPSPTPTTPEADPQAGGAPTPAPRPFPALVRAENPRQVARQILVAEDAIADPATRGRELRAMARLQQLAYRALGGRRGWDETVYDRLPARLHAVVRANVAARRDLRSLHTTLSKTLPAWRIVEPEPAEALMRYYRDAEATHGVGWEYLAAINLVETAMGRIRGTSVAGAQGPMQFIPATWATWGRGDVNDPADAIMAAARYLAASGFTRGASGVANALYAYNNHPAYVRAVTAYAKVMERRPRAFLAYHQWDVYYVTTEGELVLPVGYEQTKPVPVRRYLARHPQR